MDVSVWVCTYMNAGVPQGPEGSVGVPGAEVTVTGELPDVGAGITSQVLLLTADLFLQL